MYKSIKGFEGYEVNSDGVVRFNGSNVDYTTIDSDCKVLLINGDKIHVKSVKDIVAESFLERPENGIYVERIFKDYTNNRLCNLMWVEI